MRQRVAAQYSVEAYNLSHSSENKIHDDSIARDLGFTGGLVPGVEVFAYATHVALDHFGFEFLERGKMDCRFARPVYDGHIANVRGVANDKGGIDISVECEGAACASGHASLSADLTPPRPRSDQFGLPPADRPPADQESLAVGRSFGIHPETVDETALQQYLADVREQNQVYADKGIVHPGQLLRLCNTALKDNVLLQPWIHTGSSLQNYSSAKVGEELSVQAEVVANYERKGHRFVDLDCLILASQDRANKDSANKDRVVAHVLHTAIYQLRHLGA